MGTFSIEYKFIYPDGTDFKYKLNIDDKTLVSVNPKRDHYPDWVKLDFQKCPHCPLDSATTPYCPVSQAIFEVSETFSSMKSYEKLAVEVTTAERTYFKESDLQRALLSLFGALMASSGCPILSFFRPLLKFHLPFSTIEETIFRATSMFMLWRHFQQQQGYELSDDPLAELMDKYKNVEKLNHHILNRIKSFVTADSNKNAVVGLNLFGSYFSVEYEDGLHIISYLFDAIDDSWEYEEEEVDE